MQINIDLLDLRTVDKAIKQIEQYQKRIHELIPAFLKACAERVKEMANEEIGLYDYDVDTINGIKSGWSIEENGNGVTLINSYEKAVYIEFGTGIVGSQNQHDVAGESGYRYDVNHHGAEGWTFVKDIDSEVDMPDEYYAVVGALGHSGARIKIFTAGAPATMFLYNAATRFANSDEAARLWKNMAKDLK